jgi:hypothetical protein
MTDSTFCNIASGTSGRKPSLLLNMADEFPSASTIFIECIALLF